MTRKYEKWTFDKVKEQFASQQCELLSTEYKNPKERLNYRCSCGNISQITFSNFKAGKKCLECGKKKIGDGLRLNHDQVAAKFAEAGCVLLGNYTNSSSPMKYRCKCGKISKISWSSFNDGRRCRSCGKNEIPTLDEVRECFRIGGCELLSTEYLNNHTPLEYRCSCGNVSTISLGNFKM